MDTVSLLQQNRQVAPATYRRYIQKAKEMAQAKGQLFDAASPATDAYVQAVAKVRKIYTCQKCGKPKRATEGHSQTPFGTYCKSVDSLKFTKEQWIEQQKASQSEQAICPPQQIPC